MRNPARSRNISFMITAVCGVSIATGILLPKTVLGVNYNIGFITIGSMAGVIALIVGLQMAAFNRAFQKLLAGEGLKAQWMVPPELWREFVAYHALLAPLNKQYANRLKLTPNPPAEGVEVILGESAVIVDGDCQPIPTGTDACSFDALELLPGPPMFINMHIMNVYHTKSGTSRTYDAIRFPVPAVAAQDAADTVTWYVDRANKMAIHSRSLARRYPKQVRNIALCIAILTGIGCAIGFYTRNQPLVLDQTIAMTLAVVGVLITPVALAIAMVSHSYYKSKMKAEAAKAAALTDKPVTTHEQV